MITNIIAAALQVTNPAINAPVDNSAMQASIDAAARAAADAKAQADAAAAKADQAVTAASGTIKTVNGTTPNASGAVTIPIPTPSNTMPPSVADSGATGTMTTMYALANHTHASKARKDRVLIPASGALTVTFPTPFTTGTVPICAVVAEATLGDTNVVNAQIDGPTSATQLRIRITRTAITVATLLGLNILSVPTQIATYAHYVCLEP